MEIIDDSEESKKIFIKLNTYLMPFGKYKGTRLVDLPEPYVVWFHQNGFPEGELGELLGIVYEIKVNGLEYLFKPGHQRFYENKIRWGLK